MKLLMCPDCGDVFNLKHAVKTCGCGKTRGHYTDDLNAVYDGGVPLGFANSSFLKAVLQQPDEGRGKEFTAFVIPHVCPTFKPMPQNDGVPLVNFLADVACVSTSVARRFVVQGDVKVNGEMVDDPAARLCAVSDQPATVEYAGILYHFSPKACCG